MTLPQLAEGEWLSQDRMSEFPGDSGSDSEMDQAPVHPVKTMQGAFEESMAETMEEADDLDAPDRVSVADSVSRRKMLLEQDEYERTVAGRWKQKPGEKFHPLWKLVAQISFGMHLLQQGMAKSDEEVIKILQTHVDEIDGFLERTTEDFDLAQGDINDRIRYLRLPLEHGKVFDTMLNDRSFRATIVEGNEKIEHIIDRTAAAMNDALKDVQKGLDATRELAKYLTRVDKNWDDRTEEHDSVYLAMIGNTEGWTRAFLALQSKGSHLRKGLVQLGGIVGEMQRRAGAASRRNLAPRPAHGRYFVEAKPSSTGSRGSNSPRSPMKPLPTAPNAEAKAARIPKDASSVPASSSRKQSASSQQTASGQHLSPRKLSIPSQPASPGQHPALRQPPYTGQSVSSGQQSSPVQDVSPGQYPSPSEHHTPADNGISTRRTSSREWNSPAQDESPSQLGSPRDWMHNSMTSPLIEHAMSARRVSPAMRFHSTERVPIAKSSESRLRGIEPEGRPAIHDRTVSRSRSYDNNERSMVEERASPNGGTNRRPTGDVNNDFGHSPKEDSDPSSTELPIQTPIEIEAPPTTKSPLLVKRVSSHRITVMSTTSQYSGSLRDPVTREVSPELQRNSRGSIPNHQSYGSISFLPMHPLLSPLQDPSDSWAADAEKEFERRTSDPPKAPSPVQLIHSPQPIPAPDDSEGAVNTSHPLLLAERHTRFSSRINSAAPRNARDLPLRQYRSQEAVRRSIFSPSDEKETFVPPKRSSSLVYGQADRASSAILNSSLSLPLLANLSPFSNSSSAAPSPLNVTQTQRSLTPQPVNVLKSSKASIVTGPSSEDTLSTPSAPSNGATPPAIPRSRSSVLTHSKSTPNFTGTTEDHDVSDSEPSASHNEFKTSATNNTPFYLNPVSSTALIDFLASTPPPSPHVGRAQSPFDQGARANREPKKEYSGPFKIFPSSPAPPSPGDRAMAALNIARGSGKNKIAPSSMNSSPAENKKGFKKFFGGVGMKKAKQSKAMSTEELGLEAPQQDRYRTKKRTGKKGDRIEASEGKKEGEGEGSGFMGVGKDGVWISRKNFLKT